MKKRYTLYEIGTTLDLCGEAPQGYFVGRIEPILVTTAWKDYRSKADFKITDENLRRCCQLFPQDPIVKIDKISLTSGDSNLDISVTASHPCGIKKVTAYIAEIQEVLLQPFDIPGRQIAPLVFDGKALEAIKDFPEQNPTLRIPTKQLIGIPFYIAVTAINLCGRTAGDISIQQAIA